MVSSPTRFTIAPYTQLAVEGIAFGGRIPTIKRCQACLTIFDKMTTALSSIVLCSLLALQAGFVINIPHLDSIQPLLRSALLVFPPAVLTIAPYTGLAIQGIAFGGKIPTIQGCQACLAILDKITTALSSFILCSLFAKLLLSLSNISVSL